MTPDPARVTSRDGEESKEKKPKVTGWDDGRNRKEK